MQTYKFNFMLENISDRISVALGALGGVIVSVNDSLFTDFAFKLISTIILAAVGAVISFFIKRCLDRCYYNNKKERKTKK